MSFTQRLQQQLPRRFFISPASSSTDLGWVDRMSRRQPRPERRRSSRAPGPTSPPRSGQRASPSPAERPNRPSAERLTASRHPLSRPEVDTGCLSSQSISRPRPRGTHERGVSRQPRRGLGFRARQVGAQPAQVPFSRECGVVVLAASRLATAVLCTAVPSHGAPGVPSLPPYLADPQHWVGTNRALDANPTSTRVLSDRPAGSDYSRYRRELPCSASQMRLCAATQPECPRIVHDAWPRAGAVDP
jgi:hypothetical protein